MAEPPRPVPTPNPKPRIVEEETYKTVTRTVLGQATGEQEKIKVKVFATETARVAVMKGRTVNMGNWESVKVGVTISVPCYVEEIVDVYRDTTDLVEVMLGEEVEKLTTSLQE